MNNEIMANNQNKSKVLLVLGLIILLGVVLRLYHLNAETLWSDEIHIVQASEASISSILKNETRQNSPPLYILVEHFWVQLFGTSEFSVRFLSTLFGVLLIPAVYIAARRMLNRTEAALISALIVAISPFHIYYSQDNRPYTLLPLLSILSIYFLYRSLNENRKVLWVLYIAITTLCIYTHNFGLFLLAVGYVYVFLTSRQKSYAVFKRLLGCQFVILLLYIPWVPILKSQIAAGGAACWITRPSISAIIESLKKFNSYYGANSNTFIVLLTLASIFFIIKGVFTNSGQDTASSETNRSGKERINLIAGYNVSSSHVLLLEFLFFPLIIAYLFSILFQPIYAIGRYDSVSYPAFCILLGAGIASIKNRIGRRIIIAGIVILTCNPLYNYYYNTIKSHECRKIVSFIKELPLESKATMVVCPAFSLTELSYYSEKNDLNINVQEFFPRNKEGARAIIQSIIHSHKKSNEKVQFLTHYDSGINSRILENEVRKYFCPVKEKWFNRNSTRVVYYEQLTSDYYALDADTINFSDKSHRKYLSLGWSSTEEWGTWSEGEESIISLRFNKSKDYIMRINATGFSVPDKQQSVSIYLDDKLLGEHTFTHPTTHFEDFEVNIPSSYIKAENQQIRFDYDFTGIPAEHGLGPDLRQLAMGVSLIEFR